MKLSSTIVKIALFFFLSFAAIIVTYQLSGHQALQTSTKAIENECSYCLTEPSCCGQIIAQLNQAGDVTGLPDNQQPYHACDWPIRGYCQPKTCNQLPAGGKYRGNCGWYWMFHDASGNSYNLGTNTPTGYGCMIGLSESTMQPRCTGTGEITLAPSGSATPTAPPVSPTSQPTEPTLPAARPSTPTPLPSLEPTPIFYVTPELQFPGSYTDFESQQPTPEVPITPFTLPALKIQVNFAKVGLQSAKAVDLFSYIFQIIRYYDSKLENSINNEVTTILRR